MDTTTILQLATILAVVGSFFGLYRLLVSQKNATIESLKQQIELMKAESESVIGKALDEQVIIMERQLKRMRESIDSLKEDRELLQKLLFVSKKVLIDWADNPELEQDREAIKGWIEEEIEKLKQREGLS